jgi:hypothetical protein
MIFVFKSNAQPMHFQKMHCDNVALNLSNINIGCATQFDKDRFIVIGIPKNLSDDNFADKLIVFDTSRHKIIFESLAREIYIGYKLYAASLKNCKLILWEIENEYASFLELYMYLDNQFIFIGDFDLALSPTKKNKEMLSYPVKEIVISENEDHIQFKFLKELILHPYYNKNTNNSTYKKSLIYQLDKSTKTLTIK